MENLTGGTPPVRYLPCVVPCKLYFAKIKNITSSFEEVFCCVKWVRIVTTPSPRGESVALIFQY